jgi:hypothetical protein
VAERNRPIVIRERRRYPDDLSLKDNRKSRNERRINPRKRMQSRKRPIRPPKRQNALKKNMRLGPRHTKIDAWKRMKRRQRPISLAGTARHPGQALQSDAI